MDASFFAIVAGVVVAVEVGRHAGIFGKQFGDRAVVPKVVGLDPKAELKTPDDRPMYALPDGEVIRELI